MTSPRATRRQAIIAIVAVCALVLSVLGWATYSAILLERIETRDAHEASLNEAKAIALSKLDALVFPVLNPELTRPYEYFRPFYKPVDAINQEDGSDISQSVLLPSPLQTLRGPDWLLLHFQATETGISESWSSPQVSDSALAFATPVSAIPEADRPSQASPENWLAALKEHYTPLDLLQKLEQAVATKGASEGEDPVDLLNPEADEPDGIRQRAAEFLRRGTRLVRFLSEDRSIGCWPETVAFENLEAGAPLLTTEDAGPACVDVVPTPMQPVWVEITLDDRKQLAFIRTVTVETRDFCTLQGVLIDWTRLCESLETEVRKFLPSAEIRPVPTNAPVQPSITQSMMQTIPARLEIHEPAMAAATGISTGLTVGLAVAWGATVLALIAIGYGTMKYVSHAERRMRFVSAVTHELRTPLTSFQLHADLLADMPEENADQRKRHAETLRSESKRLARLVENVLAYSRIGVSVPELHWRRITPQSLLDAIHVETRDPCGGAGKRLVLDNRCEPNLTVETDPDFAAQILTNLVENACKYSTEADDPRVWLAAAPSADGTLAFEVDDWGPGVSSQDRRAVFQPFRRGKSEGSGRPGGVGLGLALSAYWASCLGGRLELRRSPRNQERYSSFVLTLPIPRPA